MGSILARTFIVDREKYYFIRWKMRLSGSLLATIGYAQVQNDIYFTPPQVEVLKAKGYNVDGLTVLEGDGARALSVDTLEFQKRWTQAIGFAGPHLRIPFRFIEAPYNFSPEQEAHIRDNALAEITELLGGCIEFYDDTNTKIYNDKYIVIRHKNANLDYEGCGSAMGMVTEAWGHSNGEGGKYQEIGLGPGCLHNHNTIQHEMYHALGFAHEMNRNDRDDHIRVLYDNIDEGGRVWFDKMGADWLDSDDRYDINSVMHYGGVINEAAKLYSMVLKTSVTTPVRPNNNGHVTSTDIIQLHKMYQNFCPDRPATLPCDEGGKLIDNPHYFLAGRECDGFEDCPDGSDEGITYCGSKHCSDKIVIRTPMDFWFEGAYKLRKEYHYGKPAYQKGGSGPLLWFNKPNDRWQIDDFEKGFGKYESDKIGPVLAWGSNYDGTCPQGADETWRYIKNAATGGKEEVMWEGFNMKSDYVAPPTPPPTGECKFDNDNFMRHCHANGGWQITLYDLSAESCRQRCEAEAECALAHHHPGFQIWPDNPKTNCWLWSSDALPCNWGAGALLGAHEGATMITCDKGGPTEPPTEPPTVPPTDPPVGACSDHPVDDHPDLGEWTCSTNSGTVSCVHTCKVANYKTGATAICKTTGQKQGVWAYKKKSSANCLACSAPPNSLSKFGLSDDLNGGTGTWNCNYNKATVKCTATCANGQTLPGNVYCMRKKSAAGSDNDWKSKKTGDNYWTCKLPLVCQESDIQTKIEQKVDGYSYDSTDFYHFGESLINGDYLLSGFLKCPDHADKMARTVWFYCKTNWKGKEVWKIKGDPTWVDTHPHKVKCKTREFSRRLLMP